MTMLAVNLPFSFEEPEWLWLCALVPVLVGVSIRSLAGLDPTRRVLAIIARSMLILLLAVCLAGVQSVRRNEDLTVMFVMDRSHSVQELQTAQEEFIAKVTKELPADDRVGMIDFARTAFLQQLPMRGGYHIPLGRLPQMPNTDRTDIAGAIRLSMAMFPHDTAKRIVLMSDGNDNMGDILGEARRCMADGIPIDVVPLWYKHHNEIYFDRMRAPTYAEQGEQVPIHMVIKSHRPASGTISIYHNGQLVPIPLELSRVELDPGSNTFYFKLPVNTTGVQRYEATFRPDHESMDAITLNNSQSAFTFVGGSSRVLLLSTDTDFDAVLAEALASENVDVELKDVADLATFDLIEMTNYASIILSNVPATAFTEKQQHELATYVKDMGSGLIMLGGDEGFGAGGWIGTPIEEIMPVSFEIKHKKVIPRGALVLIMHSCEMPRGNYWGKEMAKKSVDTISSQDYFGVIAYTYSPGGVNWEVPFGLANNKPAIKARIQRMQIGDMPSFAPTMQMAYKTLTSGLGRDAAQKHMIIISDGDPSPPSASLLSKYKKANITVSTIGIGFGSHVMARTMQNIARKTGGRYYAPKNPQALPQIFVKESKVVRRPLISDQPFQPQIVQYGSELLAGLDPNSGVPPLGGMVLTSPKLSTNVQVPIVRATDDGDDPVLAYWQCELGKTVAFTSGYWPRWGEDWTQWEKFASFWTQIVRWTMRQEAPANMDVRVKVEGTRARITVDALDKDASYLNFLQLRGKIVGPDGEAKPIAWTQTGPGHYEAVFDTDEAGQYLSNVQIFEGGKYRGMLRTGLTVPYSPEFRDLQTNEALLRQVADITGGRWLDMAAPVEEHDVFSHDLPPTEAKRPVWEWVLSWLLLPLFLFDVAVRRLASWLALSIAVEVLVIVVLLFGAGIWYGPWWGHLGVFVLAEMIGWTIRFQSIKPLFEFMTHGVTVLAQAGDRSAASLAQLKTTRDAVREGMTADRSESVDPASAPPDDAGTISDAMRRRKYDAADRTDVSTAASLHEALGGASSAEGYKEKRRRPAAADKASEEETEDATSRLLRAKRRARREMDDNKGDS